MEYDELLKYINEEIKVCEPDCHSHDADNQPWKAIRAVVQLHIRVLDPVGRPECLSCRRHYPCPTIQAVKKELE